MKKKNFLAASLLVSFCVAPFAAQAATANWSDAIDLLARAQAKAQACVDSLKASGNAAAIASVRGRYAEAKADADRVIAGLTTTLVEGGNAESLAEVQANVKKAGAGLKEVCDAAVEATPPESGTKGARGEIAQEPVEPEVGALNSAAGSLWTLPVQKDKLELETIKTQLGAAEWPNFGVIQETGYGLLSQIGKEENGYGLYSYAIVTSLSERSNAFLSEVFKGVPAVGDTAAEQARVNILYIPLKTDQRSGFARAAKSDGADTGKLGSEYASTFYDYRLARAILDHLCSPPTREMQGFCSADLQGPFIFTYARPASGLSPVPAPFLFVDLSDINPLAFAEFISAFKSQVKQEDLTDGARLQTLRLKILNIVLTAADWISPVQHALADIVHSAEEAAPDKGEKKE